MRIASFMFDLQKKKKKGKAFVFVLIFSVFLLEKLEKGKEPYLEENERNQTNKQENKTKSYISNCIVKYLEILR